MIDHMTFHAKDLDKTKSFYAAVLKPLGYHVRSDTTQSGTRMVGFGSDGKTDTWFTNASPVTGPGHLAWVANSHKAVDEFYDIALKSGAQDNGAPGIRKAYDKNYYAAFVIDPDGNNIEAVCHKAE